MRDCICGDRGSPRMLQQMVPDESGGPEGTAGVAGGWLDPDVFKRAFAEQPAVGDTVECDSARKHQIFHPGALVHVPGDPEHSFFRDSLDAGESDQRRLVCRRGRAP